MHRPFVLLGILGCRACAGCGPEPSIETDRDSDLPGDTDLVDTDPIETDEPPPCDFPESEPQSYDDPDVFEMETLACGEWGQPLDLDFWAVDVPSPMWLTVRLDARAVGSLGDPAVVLTAESGATASGYLLDDGYEDVWLQFPAEAGRWSVLVLNEQPTGGEEGYPYELLVGQAKVPTDWTQEEIEPNDAWSAPQSVATGVRIYGDIDGTADWFKVVVPVGKRTLRFAIDGMAYGSPGDFHLDLRDASGALVAREDDGEQGWEHDPVLIYTSSGGETLSIGVTEAAAKSGEAYWYVLDITEEE